MIILLQSVVVQFHRLFFDIFCITKCDRLLLQSVSGITKCDRRYYNLRQVLQSATVITK